MTSHEFIQKMHYSLTSYQLYFLVPLSSFLAHFLALCHIYIYIYIYMSLCQKVLGEDHPFFGHKYFCRFKFSLNKPNFIRKSMHQRDNKDKPDPQSQFWVSKIWKFTLSPGRKSTKEEWTFRVYRFSCGFVCIFLLQAIFIFAAWQDIVKAF